MEILFKYGFTYKGVNYGWKNKKLYRLPYIKSNRNYSFREVPSYVFKTTTVYNVQRTKLTINRLEALTKSIQFTVVTIEDSDCPF